MRVDVEAVQEDLRKAGLVLLAAAIIEHFIKGAGLNLTVVLSGIVMWNCWSNQIHPQRGKQIMTTIALIIATVMLAMLIIGIWQQKHGHKH